MGIRPLHVAELPSAAAMLALAFDEDPLFRFMLPEARRRALWLGWFQSFALRQAFAAGGALTLDEGPELGAMAILPPGAWPQSLGRMAAAADWPPTWPTRRLLTVGLAVERRIVALHPPERHVYVFAIGVHPTQKGRGLGGALLQHACALARREGVVAHLETSNPVNLPFYRRFGFEVATELSSQGCPPVWTMTTPGAPGPRISGGRRG